MQSHYISFGALKSVFGIGVAMDGDKQVGFAAVGDLGTFMKFNEFIGGAGKYHGYIFAL